MTKEQERTATTEGLNLPEEKKTLKDQLSDQLMQGIQDIMSGDDYKKWLDTSSHFFTRGYSEKNAILIFLQNPEASYTMGYEAWKEYGRNVMQGAKGAKIFVPVMAYEKTEGALHRMIMSNLRDQIKQSPGQIAVYKVGTSKIEFTMNRNDQVGLRINGKEKVIFPNEKEMKKFISNAILGKVPMYYSVGTVFDVKDTIIPEYLWIKKGYTKDEVVKDENRKSIKNRKGEVKIVNSTERQAKFKPEVALSIAEKDPAKMAILYEALKTVSERNGIPVMDIARDSDKILQDGADGYFSRKFTEQNPKGFIVMPNDLEPTRKCAVIMHEMAHSDLHGDLAKLATEIGEERIPQHTREIQAESVAYAMARQFGIETDISSFQYLAAYSKGFELQDMQKSLNTIYLECQKLTREIATELDKRGLNLDLTEKPLAPMEKENVETLSKKYTAFALEQSESISTKQAELPSLAADNRLNPYLLGVIKEKKFCLDRQENAVQKIHNEVTMLQEVDAREAQNTAIKKIEAAIRSIESEKIKFSELTTSFVEISYQSKATLKEKYVHDPMRTLEVMKKDQPKLEDLSTLQLSYVAQSTYIRNNFSKLLKTDPEKFVNEVCKRAEALNRVVSKNGAFVEIIWCEQWTDKPIVQDGALLHPKVADSIAKQAETQICGLKAEAQKIGDYFPYVKCNMTVFTKLENAQTFTAYRTQVDFGNGMQKSLVDHLTKLCGKESQLVVAFDKAICERGTKDKIICNESLDIPKTVEEVKESGVHKLQDTSTHEEWIQAIEQEKSRTQNQIYEVKTTDQEKSQNKSNKEY